MRNTYAGRLRGKTVLLGILAVCVGFATVALAITYASRAERPPGPTTAQLPIGQQSEPQSAEPITQPTTAEPTAPPTLPPITVGNLEGKKLVALTFDDGPHSTYTVRLLDFLREQDVPVTFFMLGCNAVGVPDIPRRAAAEGHQVGSHTYNHKDLTKLSAVRLSEEIESCAALLEELTGQRPTVMRPPYGAQNAQVRAAAGTPVILWQIDPKDWSTRNADKTYQHVMEYVQDGDIVLMHDCYAETIEAAKRIIPALKAQGYTFVTVDQLLAARGGAEPGETVFKRRPPASPEEP